MTVTPQPNLHKDHLQLNGNGKRRFDYFDYNDQLDQQACLHAASAPERPRKLIGKTESFSRNLETTRREYLEARAKRQKKDDDEMYQGLRQFKGSQRGWDGRHKSERT